MNLEWDVFRLSGEHDQEGAKSASNIFFASFVAAILIFTIIAATYRPPDPWLQSPKSLTPLLTTPNVTLEPDESVVITAEDTPLLSPVSLPQPITETLVDEGLARNQLNSSRVCNVQKPVNCSAPGVLLTIEKYNLKLFKSLEFYQYTSPVRGSSNHECDTAWLYRYREDGSTRLFRDFRRYRILVLDDCALEVERVGGWHSGGNALTDFGSEASVYSISDEPLNISGNSFSPDEKYLFYERSGDYCKSMNQYVWSLLCALGEAQFLNRTFVMDLDVCLSSSNNEGYPDEPGKDFRFYYDYEHLKDSLAIIDKKQFLEDWTEWDANHPRQKVSEHKVEYKTTPMELTSDPSTVLTRTFNQPQQNLYWFQVCEGDAEHAIRRPWHALWKSRRINDIVLAICAKMGWDYDAVHVVRGEKANNKKLWPHLDSDTTPEAIVRKVEERIMYGRNLYIATNEQDEFYFDKLRGKWKVSQLNDFKEFWANTSEWYREMTKLNDGRPVAFDGYMRVEVDSEVLYKARNRIETFNDLTMDCKSGINSC